LERWLSDIGIWLAQLHDMKHPGTSLPFGFFAKDSSKSHDLIVFLGEGRFSCRGKLKKKKIMPIALQKHPVSPREFGNERA
jgi:hypothetical protein